MRRGGWKGKGNVKEGREAGREPGIWNGRRGRESCRDGRGAWRRGEMVGRGQGGVEKGTWRGGEVRKG